jgi:hypothetical protein
LRVDEPVLREALRIAANERRSEVKPKAMLLTPAIKRAERQLIKMLFEAADFREKLGQEIAQANLHHGLETRNIFEALISTLALGEIPDASALSSRLDDKDRRLIFEILFESLPEGTWDDAESCLNFLRNLPITEELATLQRQIEGAPPPEEMKRLVVRRMELLRLLSSQREVDKNLPIQ